MHRRDVVGVFPDAAQREGAFGGEPSEDFARSQWRAGGGRAFVARGWALSARYWSEAAKEREDSSGIFYYWKGERPLDPDCAATGRDGGDQVGIGGPGIGVLHDMCVRPEPELRHLRRLLRAESTDMGILDGRDDRQRVELIAERLRNWKGMKSG